MSSKLSVTVLPGDGIGPEVTREAVRVLGAAAEAHGIRLEFFPASFGGDALRQGKPPYPPETRELTLAADAVLLGAVGDPAFDGAPAAERPEAALLDLRRTLGVWANLRPARSLECLLDAAPLKPEVARGSDILIVRELSSGIYYGEPRGRTTGDDGRTAVDSMVYNEHEIERVARMAFTLARERSKRIISVDKANVLHTSRLWREVVEEVATDFRDVTLEHLLVDACAMALVTRPTAFDVILTSNLFGDVLSDECAVLFGSLGVLPSASLGGRTDLYEPVHGSAPDIAGKGIANPVGAILSAALLLRHTAGREDAARTIEEAVDSVLAGGLRTPDVQSAGASPASTEEVGRAVAAEVGRLAHHG